MNDWPGYILILICLILIIIGIVLVIAFNNVEWYVWTIILVGAGLGILGAILLYIVYKPTNTCPTICELLEKSKEKCC